MSACSCPCGPVGDQPGLCGRVQEVVEQLERVYAAAPTPEDYMKYQLHMHTGLEVAHIDQWFRERRARDAPGNTPSAAQGALSTPHHQNGCTWRACSRHVT